MDELFEWVITEKKKNNFVEDRELMFTHRDPDSGNILYTITAKIPITQPMEIRIFVRDEVLFDETTPVVVEFQKDDDTSEKDGMVGLGALFG